MKKHNKLLVSGLLALGLTFTSAACSPTGSTDLADKIDSLQAQITELQEELNGYYAEEEQTTNTLATHYGEECYEKIKYIDEVLKDRDSIGGEKYKLAQKWIFWNLIKAGYTEGVDIVYHNFTYSKYYKADVVEDMITASDYTTDGKLYTRQGWKYVEDENGTYVKANIIGSNIVVTKKGKTDKQIIVGAHYDGTGTGDNGSGISLALTTAEHLYNVETEYTIKFVFFDAEEYGLYGSTAYAYDMTEEEINNTLYMINMDSLVCGDYCYLYGGVQDDETQTVTETEAFDNAMAVASNLGLTFKNNPWTWENPAPGYDSPDYAAPSTGDWSDHVGFKEVGIKYVYFEATNWDIPGPYNEYDGYGETYLIGMLMNTENDYLEFIEKYFPGRILNHITQFSTLLNALVTQSDINF